MTEEEMAVLFETHRDEEYIEFTRVKDKASRRPDLHGFLLLERLVPSTGSLDMVAAAEHDRIWLRTDTGRLAKAISEDQVVELLRCGVDYDPDTESLTMNV